MGSVANPRSGRCECPMFSHEKHMDNKRFCECPAHATWDAAINGCACAPNSGLVLTHQGCVKDHSEECFKKPMSWYESGDNSCVSVMNCPPHMSNCNRCESRHYYSFTGTTGNGMMRCTECAHEHKMMGNRCIRHDAKPVACAMPASGTAAAVVPAHLQGCKKCYNAKSTSANTNPNT